MSLLKKFFKESLGSRYDSREIDSIDLLFSFSFWIPKNPDIIY